MPGTEVTADHSNISFNEHMQRDTELGISIENRGPLKENPQCVCVCVRVRVRARGKVPFSNTTYLALGFWARLGPITNFVSSSSDSNLLSTPLRCQKGPFHVCLLGASERGGISGRQVQVYGLARSWGNEPERGATHALSRH